MNIDTLKRDPVAFCKTFFGSKVSEQQRLWYKRQCDMIKKGIDVRDYINPMRVNDV
jgi:hypothetical protein